MTTLNETSDSLRIMEKRLAELEKKNEMQEKTICKLRMENEEMKEKLEETNRDDGNFFQHQDSSEEMEKVSVLSIEECILSYMDPNKRILLSFHFPEFERIEKMIPLKLANLTISSLTIEIDDTVYRFVNEEPICSMERSGTFDIIESFQSEKSIAAITRMVFHFFSGRKNIQVDKFKNYLKIPFNLDIHVELIHLYSSIENYEGLVQSVDCVTLCDNETSHLTHPLIRNAKKLNFSNAVCLLSLLPNIQNETVEAYWYHHTRFLVHLIKKYCENGNRKIGSKLILSVDENLKNSALNAVFDSGELVNYGFQWIFRDVFRYPIENNSEIRITAGETCSEKFYIHLDVVPFTPPAPNPAHFFNLVPSVWNF